MNDNIEELRLIFEEELDELIKSFRKKRESYKSKNNILLVSYFITSSLVVLSVGLTFIENIEVIFKILSLGLSSISAILLGIINMSGFNMRWIQRTTTLVFLYQIRRQYKFSKPNLTYNDLNGLMKNLQDVMSLDIKTWCDDTTEIIQKQEKIYGRHDEK